MSKPATELRLVSAENRRLKTDLSNVNYRERQSRQEATDLRTEIERLRTAIEFVLSGYEFRVDPDGGELHYRHVEKRGAFLRAPESLIRLRAALDAGESSGEVG